MSTPRKTGADLSNQPIHLRGNLHGAARQDLEAALTAAQLQGRPVPCRGVEAHAWTADDTGTLEVAALLCEDCPVLAVCAAYAVAAGEDGGAWGAMTPAGIKRARRRAQEHKTRRAERAA